MLCWYGGPGLASSMRTFIERLHLPTALAFLVIASELFSGVGLIVGLFSRIAALVVALTMAGAIAALVIVVQGSGAFSLDRLLHKHISALEQSQEAT